MHLKGLKVTKLRDWSFVHRVVGRDIVIAGHDYPSKAPTDDKRRRNWCPNLGTRYMTHMKDPCAMSFCPLY